jgi:hypothetical protein
MKKLLLYVTSEYIIPLLFTHIFLIILASFVIESYIICWQDHYCRGIVINALGATFLASLISTMVQQAFTCKFFEYLFKYSGVLTKYFCFQIECAILFVFVCYPVACILIVYGVRTYWVLSLFFLFWEMILIIAVFVHKVKRAVDGQN